MFKNVFRKSWRLLHHVKHKMVEPYRRHMFTVLVTVQRDAAQSSLFIILRVHSTCFGCQPRPSSRVHKTVTTISGTGHIFCASTKLAWPRWREVPAQKIWPVPEAVVKDLCIPDDGCGWHPKHVEWTCRIINRLLCHSIVNTNTCTLSLVKIY